MRRNWTAGLAVGLASAVLLAGANTAHAQARGGTTGGTSGLGSSGLGSSGLGSSGLGGGGLGSSGLGGGGLGGGGLSGGLSGGGMGSSPFGGSSGVGFMGGGGGTFGTSGGGGGRGGAGGGSTSYGTTGPMGPYFGNPLSLGVPATTNATITRTRTFGTILYNVNSQTGMSSSGLGGTANLSTSRGMGATSAGMRRAPAYMTVLGETVPPVQTDMVRIRADLQDVIARSRNLPSRGNIRVLAEGPIVVLRGNVASARERRLAESVIRLTHGVRAVRNELVIPESAATARP